MIGKLLALVIGVAVVCTMAATLYEDAPHTEDSTDIIIIMGQSNATYRPTAAEISEAEPVPAPGTAWYYGVKTRPANFSYPASECRIWPISDQNGARIGDKWPAMAAAYVEASERNVVIAECAEVGQSITQFSPTDPGRLWVASKQRLTDVIEKMEAAGLHPGRINVVWIQGEADRYMSAEEYEQRLTTIGETMFNGGLGHSVDIPIWISLTKGTGGSVEAQKAIVNDRAGLFRMGSTLATTFTPANGLLQDDWTHYTQAGNNLLGADLGEAVGEAAKEAVKADRTIWGIVGIGLFAMMAFAAVVLIVKRA